MLKRLFLFLLTNLLIVTTISILITVLGLHHYFSANGINYITLAVVCFIWRSSGAFISLLMSKWVAKTAMGVELVESDQTSPHARALIQLVSTLSKKAGLTTPPEVGIYHSSELNAFATGPSRTSSLLAVSTGLLQNLNHAEVEGVIGHEISHIANGDMVTMTLILGVVNSFSLFLSRLIAYTIATATSRGDHEDGFSSGVYFILTLVFDILFTLLGSMLVATFSRYREYRADAGGAKLCR